nr:TPA_asm: NADH dehydrogenase subunit 2 [Melanodrymia brightae]
MILSNFFIFIPYGFLFFIMTVFGTIYSLSASHWLTAWMGLEINLIAFIPLMVYGGSVLETESTIKYFIFQAIGSVMIMFSSLLSFGPDFIWIFSSHSFDLLLSKSLIILILGLLLKLGVFPVHFWFPAVVAGLSWFMNFLLFTWQKVAPMFILFSIYYVWLVSNLSLIIMIAASGSSILGGVGGVNQTQLRALLAYSSISHMGWMIFCCCLTETSLKIYFIIYFFVTACVFFSAWSAQLNLIFQSFSSFLGENFLARILMIFMLLSLGGIPPLLGFIPKWVVMMSTNLDMKITLLFLILGSLISLFYYFTLMFSTFFSSTSIMWKNLYLNLTFSKSNMNMLMILGVGLNLLGGVALLMNSYFKNFL